MDIEPAPQLSEQEATTLGCQLMGEAFVIGVGLALLVHQEASERAAEEDQQRVLERNSASFAEAHRRLQALEQAQLSLITRVVCSEARAAELERELARVRGRRWWWSAT